MRLVFPETDPGALQLNHEWPSDLGVSKLVSLCFRQREEKQGKEREREHGKHVTCKNICVAEVQGGVTKLFFTISPSIVFPFSVLLSVQVFGSESEAGTDSEIPSAIVALCVFVQKGILR